MGFKKKIKGRTTAFVQLTAGCFLWGFFFKSCVEWKSKWSFLKIFFLLLVLRTSHFLSFLRSQWSDTSPKRSQRWRSTLLNAPHQGEEGMRIAERVMAGALPHRRDRVKGMTLCKVRTGISTNYSCLAVTCSPYPSKIPSAGWNNGYCSECSECLGK